MDLKNNEMQAAGEIISRGLLKAAESLSLLMKENIETSSFSYSPPNLMEYDAENHERTEYYILVTRIIGEISGVCCLIVNPEEAERIRFSALPEELRNNPEMMKLMENSVLLEADNIISASVITQFSQALKVKMHGGVPNLQVMTQMQMTNYIQSLLDNSLYFLRFNTRFKSENHSFQPHFLWFFDEKFYQRIKSLTSQVV